MGTSRGYKMPTGGNWTPLKNNATDFVQGNNGPTVSPRSIVRDFIRANGGFRGLSLGNGGQTPSVAGTRSGGGASGGRAGGGPSRSAMVGTARNLGGFLSRVGEVGLAETLRERGLEDLIGKSSSQVSDMMLDEFAGPGSTLDNAVAREALADVRDEILQNAESFEDVEQALNQTLDDVGLFGVLASFFGSYVFRLFCRNFYEVWHKKVGDAKASKALREIRDYITSSLRAKLAARDLKSVNWKAQEGLKVTDEILKETLDVFGVTG